MKKAISVGLTLVFCGPIFAEIENEIPLGVEVVSGIRSAYVYRGFKLADTSLDLQIEAELALSNESSINLGTWHLSESSGDFSETGAFLDLRSDLNDQTTIGSSLTFRNFRGTALESGLDVGLFVSHQFDDSWDSKAGVYYDLGNDAFYASAGLRWSKPFSEKAFIAVENSVSYVSDYLEHDGFNDYYGRLSLTYAMSDTVSFTPFVGWSIQLDDSTSDDSVFGGLWFEFIF